MRPILQSFRAELASRGLDGSKLHPWRGWLAFKEFVRALPHEAGHAVSLQLRSNPVADEIVVFLMCQESGGDDRRPLGAMVVELDFPHHDGAPDEWELWAADVPPFEKFVDLVERHPTFARLVLEKPVSTDVYYEAAEPV